MITLLAALSFAIQGKSLLDQVCPKPTGRNGYEEYLRAADVVNSPEARLLLQWVPGMSKQLEARLRKEAEEGEPPDSAQQSLLSFARRLEGLSLLEVRREAVGRYGTALDWVRQGNQKPVWDPRENLDFSTPYPEASVFRDLTLLALADAYVKDAEGQGPRATETLIQALSRVDKASLGTLLGVLIGISQEAVLLSAFQERLPRISQVDARRTIAFLDDRLAGPPSVREALRKEAEVMVRGVDQMITDPAVAFGEGGPYAALADRLRALSPTEVATLARRLRSGIEAAYVPLLKLLDGPESGWGTAEAMTPGVTTGTTLEDLADQMVALLVPPLDRVLGVSAARARTQLRLLRLASRVIAFRWEHERLPTALEDVAPAGDIADPLTGEKFRYEPMSDRFRVFSRGTSKTGEIDIRYQRPAGVRVPPPAAIGPIRPMGPIWGF